MVTDRRVPSWRYIPNVELSESDVPRLQQVGKKAVRGIKTNLNGESEKQTHLCQIILLTGCRIIAMLPFLQYLVLPTFGHPPPFFNFNILKFHYLNKLCKILCLSLYETYNYWFRVKNVTFPEPQIWSCIAY